jgi:hypothetical protein
MTRLSPPDDSPQSLVDRLRSWKHDRDVGIQGNRPALTRAPGPAFHNAQPLENAFRSKLVLLSCLPHKTLARNGSPLWR